MDSRTVCTLGTKIIVKVIIRPWNLQNPSTCSVGRSLSNVSMYQTALKIYCILALWTSCRFYNWFLSLFLCFYSCCNQKFSRSLMHRTILSTWWSLANLLFGACSRALELFMQSRVSYQKLLHLWRHLSLIQSVFTRHCAHTLEIKVYRRNIRAFRYLKPLTLTSISLPKRSSSSPMRIASNVPASFSSLYAKVCLHREHPLAWLWMLQVLVKFKVPHILFCSDPILTSLQRKRNGQITLHA